MEENNIHTFNSEGTTLRKTQLRMLEILKEVDRVCKKHNIPYWLDSGTLIGAVRHQGFIPWDDDLDIQMLRPDFKRFIKIFPRECAQDFVLQTNKTDKNYMAPYAKVRDLNSCISENNNKLDTHYTYKGLYIDVFLLEPSVEKLAVLGRKFQVVVYYFSVFKTDTYKLKTCFANFVRWIVYNIVFRCFRLFAKMIGSKHLYHTYGSGFLKYRIKEEIFPLTELDFEGEKFPAPHDYDAFLRRIYGDYMQLPDLNTVKNHINKVEFYIE